LLQLASSSLLRLGQEVDKEAIKNRESIYLLLDLVSSHVMCKRMGSLFIFFLVF
jgi:hypothetical protein